MRKTAVGFAAALGALAMSAPAQAHVSLHPNTLPAGSFPTVDMRVPNEEDKASMNKLAVQFPPGFLDVSTGYMPGWSVHVKTQKLAKPVTTDEGTITQQVREVDWSGGRIPPGSFLDFPLSLSMPDSDTGKTLAFKAVQSYDNGKVVRWIGPASSDSPAPTVNVTAKGGLIEDVAGTETGPGSAQAATRASGVTTTEGSAKKVASKGLGIAALIVGIVALLAALAGIALARRPRAGTARA